MRVLNVGGGSSRNLPPLYRGWEQDLLDIDPNIGADIVCDAKRMRTLAASKYDAVFCSHNLEHFAKHEIPEVLAGMLHVLKPTGFANIVVPNIEVAIKAMVAGGHDIGDLYYMAGPNPITFHDVFYGWGRMTANGNPWYAHKTGFTPKTLGKALRAAGFTGVHLADDGVGNLFAFAFKRKPSAELLRMTRCR
jgi:SAM-dependent methyltransferase